MIEFNKTFTESLRLDRSKQLTQDESDAHAEEWDCAGFCRGEEFRQRHDALEESPKVVASWS